MLTDLQALAALLGESGPVFESAFSTPQQKLTSGEFDFLTFSRNSGTSILEQLRLSWQGTSIIQHLVDSPRSSVIDRYAPIHDPAAESNRQQHPIGYCRRLRTGRGRRLGIA
jgi:hypothetical protein